MDLAIEAFFHMQLFLQAAFESDRPAGEGSQIFVRDPAKRSSSQWIFRPGPVSIPGFVPEAEPQLRSIGVGCTEGAPGERFFTESEPVFVTVTVVVGDEATDSWFHGKAAINQVSRVARTQSIGRSNFTNCDIPPSEYGLEGLDESSTSVMTVEPISRELFLNQQGALLFWRDFRMDLLVEP